MLVISIESKVPETLVYMRLLQPSDCVNVRHMQSGGIELDIVQLAESRHATQVRHRACEIGITLQVPANQRAYESAVCLCLSLSLARARGLMFT